ncbi:roadblock/LC7 domain-containing protein [Moorena sp. SIO3H5]|uniref:roadblock/LC7 domain-containing protein n=1 Tax=Moorena sp. SIO3H5 TaxID=2607834 RepID=UPI0013BE6C23|nr:roadblock/LC7 domain-containing protein [Moorena sp. SIO3H5]NEO73556.1 diacylglyceryl transferase [Moorena sp. SIO3H5]
MAINSQKLGYILHNFVTSTADIQGAAVVTTDGLPLASSLPGEMDEERVSAMSAAMLSLGERIGSELARGDIDRIYVEGKEGFSVLTSCGEEAVFLVLASKAAKQGVLMLEIKRTLAELKPMLI